MIYINDIQRAQLRKGKGATYDKYKELKRWHKLYDSYNFLDYSGFKELYKQLHEIYEYEEIKEKEYIYMTRLKAYIRKEFPEEYKEFNQYFKEARKFLK